MLRSYFSKHLLILFLLLHAGQNPCSRTLLSVSQCGCRILHELRVGVVLERRRTRTLQGRRRQRRLHGTTNDLKDDDARQRDECCFPPPTMHTVWSSSFCQVLHVASGWMGGFMSIGLGMIVYWIFAQAMAQRKKCREDPCQDILHPPATQQC